MSVTVPANRRVEAFGLLRNGAIALVMACSSQSARAQALDESCTVSILNRTVRVNPDGSWVRPNVPANFGYVRARATCIVNGVTVSGESEPFLLPANETVNLPDIVLGSSTPIPTSLSVTAPTPTLTTLGATAQLTVDVPSE